MDDKLLSIIVTNIHEHKRPKKEKKHDCASKKILINNPIITLSDLKKLFSTVNQPEQAGDPAQEIQTRESVFSKSPILIVL